MPLQQKEHTSWGVHSSKPSGSCSHLRWGNATLRVLGSKGEASLIADSMVADLSRCSPETLYLFFFCTFKFLKVLLSKTFFPRLCGDTIHAHSASYVNSQNDIGYSCDLAIIYGTKEPLCGWSMMDICIDNSMLLSMLFGVRLPVSAHLSEVLNNNCWTSFDSSDYPPWPNITVSTLSMTYPDCYWLAQLLLLAKFITGSTKVACDGHRGWSFSKHQRG